MCRSSFRVCIGPPGLQLSQNTTLPFYFSQYSNKFSRISRFDKCERILRSFRLLLVNEQAPCTPSGCLWVLFTQIISAHIKFPPENFRWLVPFFTQVTRSLVGPMRQLHRYSDSVTVPVLAHHNTNLVALLTSNTSSQPLCGILFIVSMIYTSSDMRQISPFYN